MNANELTTSSPMIERNPIERVTLGRPVIDTNHAQIHAGNAFSLVGSMAVAAGKVGAIEFYVPGEDEATVTIDMTNANADLTYTAVAYGTAGNSITVTHVDPSANDAILTVVISGTDIVVNLATGPAGAITSTAAQVAAAIAQSGQASALVTCTAEGTGAGIVEAKAEASLAGGASPAYIHMQDIEVSCSAGPASFSLLEDYWMDPTAAGAASSLTPQNHHRILGTASVLDVLGYADVTATTGGGAAAGDTLATVPLHGTGVGSAKVAGSGSTPQERVLLPGKKYLLAMSNANAGSVTFGYNVFWYEEAGA